MASIETFIKHLSTQRDKEKVASDLEREDALKRMLMSESDPWTEVTNSARNYVATGGITPKDAKTNRTAVDDLIDSQVSMDESGKFYKNNQPIPNSQGPISQGMKAAENPIKQLYDNKLNPLKEEISQALKTGLITNPKFPGYAYAERGLFSNPFDEKTELGGVPPTPEEWTNYMDSRLKTLRSLTANSKGAEQPTSLAKPLEGTYPVDKPLYGERQGAAKDKDDEMLTLMRMKTNWEDYKNNPSLELDRQIIEDGAKLPSQYVYQIDPDLEIFINQRLEEDKKNRI